MALRKFANDTVRIDEAFDRFLEKPEHRQVYATAFLIKALDGFLDARCYRKLGRVVEKNLNLFESERDLETCNKLLLGALLAADTVKFAGEFLGMVNFAKYVYGRVDGSGASFYTKLLSARVFRDLQTEQFYDLLAPNPAALRREPRNISDYCYAEMLFGASVTIENAKELSSLADLNSTLPPEVGTGDELSDLAFFALMRLSEERTASCGTPRRPALGFSTFPPATGNTRSWALVAFSRSEIRSRKIKTMGALARLEPAPKIISRGLGTLSVCEKSANSFINLNGLVERSPGRSVPYTIRWYSEDAALYLYTGLFSESRDFGLRVLRENVSPSSGTVQSRKLAGGAISVRTSQTLADGFVLSRSVLASRRELFVFTALVPPSEQSTGRPRQQADARLPPRFEAKTWPPSAHLVTMDRMPVSSETFVGMIDFFAVYSGPEKRFECRKGRDHVSLGRFTVRMGDFAVLCF